MNYHRGSPAKVNRSFQWRALVSMLLFLYLAVYLYPSVSIPHVHYKQELHSGDSCQKDACHKAIYHPGSEGKCNHKFHFTKAEEKCPWCNSIVSRQWHFSGWIQMEVLSFDYPPVFNYTAEEVSTSSLVHFDRGPPLFFMI